jgi:antitoxin component of MazEF toxin-antitoxin module
VKFRTTILQGDKTATGIRVPDEVMTALNAGKKPKVNVTINGHTYRSSVATVDGQPMIGVSEVVRQAAEVKGGDTVDVDVELDTAPRTVEVPADLAAALDKVPAARKTFDGLSYSLQRFWVEPVVGAKTDETRQRRIEKAVATLREGRSR